MKRGPKFEITQDMAITNIQVVCKRLNLTTITRQLYEEHGSFSLSSLERKWGWRTICELAGVQCGTAWKKAGVRADCSECTHRLAKGHGRYCATCHTRMKRNSQGAID